MKKSKKILALGLATLCVVSSFSVLGACTKEEFEIDETKSQLYVGNYKGGMGDRWMTEYVKGFEETYKDTSFEPGKTGVQVLVVPDQLSYASDTIYNSIEQSEFNIYLSEMMNYNKFAKSGLLYDMTDIVKATIPGESKTIEDKLTAEQKEYFNYDGKYYGLPHYRAYSGLIYDIDLFNEKKLYIKADGTINGKQTDSDLSYGPNGVKGGGDDGLPATYDEFFRWCEYVSTSKNVIPVCLSGSYKENYTEFFLNDLFVDAQGAQGAKLKYSMPAEPVSTKVITGFNGNTPIETTMEISRSNYKDAAKMSGLYYALDFLERLVDGDYFDSMAFNTTQSHDMTHYDFLQSRFDPTKTPIAMMIEGTWWEEESNSIFEEMEADYGEEASRSARNFGLLPLPKVNASYAGPQTMYDMHSTLIMINGNCDAAHADIAKKFVQYITTDEALQLFHTTTGVGRGYEYDLTPEQQESLTSFGKSIYALQKGAVTVTDDPKNAEAYNWKAKNTYELFATVKYRSPISAFISSSGPSAKAYFEGIYSYLAG